MQLRYWLVGLVIVIVFSCTGEEEPFLSPFPTTFAYKGAQTTGMRTYFYTDSVIFRVDNLPDVDSISTTLDSIVIAEQVQFGATGDQFAISKISFTDVDQVSITYFENGQERTTDVAYNTLNNIVGIPSPLEVNFKINEDYSLALTCYTHGAKRTVDTLFIDQDNLFPDRDTFDTEAGLIQLIPTDEEFVDGFCLPIDESLEVRRLTEQLNFSNNDLLILHRMDFRFEPLEE